jgi:hypothetical protein
MIEFMLTVLVSTLPVGLVCVLRSKGLLILDFIIGFETCLGLGIICFSLCPLKGIISMSL